MNDPASIAASLDRVAGTIAVDGNVCRVTDWYGPDGKPCDPLFATHIIFQREGCFHVAAVGGLSHD